MDEIVGLEATVTPVVIASPDRSGNIQAIAALRERPKPGVDLWKTLKARWLVVSTRSAFPAAAQRRAAGMK